MQRLPITLLMLFAFAVPWEHSFDVGAPFGDAARIVGILLLLAVIPAVLAARGMRRPQLLQWLVLTLYLYFACTYFWTVDQETTLEKIRAYFQVMMMVWIVWEVADAPAHLRGILRAFVAGCWVLAALTFLNYTSAGGAAEQLRYAAAGQDPNDVARFLDLGFPLATLLFAVDKRWLARALAIAYVPAGFMAVLLTASRGGFAAAIAALVGSAVLLVMWRPRAASVVFAGLAVMAGALLLFIPAESLNRLATIPGELGSGDLNARADIWSAGWHAFTQAPWQGSGAGTFTAAAGLPAGDTAHNTLMAVLVTGGLTGATIFVAVLVCVVVAVVHTRGLLRVALATTLIVWAITSMVGSVEENRATWLLFGVAALAARLELEEPPFMQELFSGQLREKSKRLRYAVHSTGVPVRG